MGPWVTDCTRNVRVRNELGEFELNHRQPNRLFELRSCKLQWKIKYTKATLKIRLDLQ